MHVVNSIITAERIPRGISMLKLNCPTCGKRLKVPDRLLGKRIGCSGCRNEVEVTSTNSTVGPDDSAPLSLGDELLAPLPPLATPHVSPRPVATIPAPM